MRLRRATAAISVALAACHATIRHEDTRRGETRLVRIDAPRPGAPTLEVTAEGRFRLVEPLVCPLESVTEMTVTTITQVRPNLATTVVGVIAAAGGGVATATGWSSDEPTDSPWSYLGPLAVVIGATFIVAPLFGNRVEETPAPSRDARAPAGDERCGERGVDAPSVRLSWRGLEAWSPVDRAGYLALSPFRIVDGFAIGHQSGLLVTGAGTRATGEPLAFEAVIDPASLAHGRAAFFAAASVDATVEPLRKVPRLEPGALRVTRASRGDHGELAIELPLNNTGPGDAYGVRIVTSTDLPELDQRVIYVGRVPAKSSVQASASLVVSAEVDRALATTPLAISALILDAHETAPSTPVRFRGIAPTAAVP